ncbi:MAG: transposase [Bacteroidia bacterium]
MSRKYKMLNPVGIYFVSFATVFWIDVFVRQLYFEIVADSLNHSIKEKTMTLFAYCIMPSHVHLVFSDRANEPGKLLKEMKMFTSKKLRKCISENTQESRKEWVLWMMKRAGLKTSNVKEYQFWQQHNKPIELRSNEVIDQKISYVHNNPVEAGFVCKPEYWQYSSASDYCGIKGPVEIEVIE